MEFNNINGSPVKCFRWLKVNEANTQIPFIENKKYELKYCDFIDTKDYSLREYENNFKCEIDGVSKETIKVVEDNFNAGYSITIKENEKVDKPIVINFEFDENNNQLVDFGEIVAEKNSSANIFIIYNQKSEFESSRVGTLKINAQENSKINVTKINLTQNSIESIYVQEDKDAVVNIVAIDLAKEVNVTNYLAKLNGENSQNAYMSAYLGQNNDFLDFTFKIDHIGKNTNGFMDTRGILQDNAKKTLRNAINFVQGAIKAKGAESEYVMILSPNVLNNSIPLLLCTEDDVSGEHAAGIGRIDDSVMFYLMSRGLSYDDAKKLIMQGYLNPIIDRIQDEQIKDLIYDEIEKRTAS